MKDIRLLFTKENRAAVRDRIKSQTRRVDPKLDEFIARIVGGKDVELFPTLTPDNEWVFWVGEPVTEYKTALAYPKGSHVGLRSRQGCPQREPVRYWLREPVRVLELEDFADGVTPSLAYVEYLDCGSRKYQCITESDAKKLMNGPWLSHRSTHPRFMFKSFTRTWLQGVRVWPERLGDISPEDAIAEGIDLDPDVVIEPFDVRERNTWAHSSVWRDYLSGGYDLSPTQSHASLWESINGAGSWDPKRWVWAVAFKPEGE